MLAAMPYPAPQGTQALVGELCRGLVARGRQLGRLLLAEALRETGRQHLPHLSLAVDGRNHFALRLYREFGFISLFRRTAYINSARWGREP